MCSSRVQPVGVTIKCSLNTTNREFLSGTGKSVLLREIVKSLKETSSVIGITASTGIASVNIGGTTVHSWAGIGLGVEPAKKLAGMVMGQPKLRKVFDRWRETDALIIDEGEHHPFAECHKLLSQL